VQISFFSNLDDIAPYKFNLNENLDIKFLFNINCGDLMKSFSFKPGKLK